MDDLVDIAFSKAFDKQFMKLPIKKQQCAKDAIALFLDDGRYPKLCLHELKGDWAGHYSISAGGDLRVYFKLVRHDSVLFIALGSHSQLYR